MIGFLKGAMGLIQAVLFFVGVIAVVYNHPLWATVAFCMAIYIHLIRKED